MYISCIRRLQLCTRSRCPRTDPALADRALVSLLLFDGRLRLATLGSLGFGEALVGEALLRSLGLA